MGQENILGWHSPGEDIGEEQGNRNCSPQHSRLSSGAQKEKGGGRRTGEALAVKDLIALPVSCLADLLLGF